MSIDDIKEQFQSIPLVDKDDSTQRHFEYLNNCIKQRDQDIAYYKERLVNANAEVTRLRIENAELKVKASYMPDWRAI